MSRANMAVNLDLILARRGLTKENLRKKIGSNYMYRFARRVNDWKTCGILLEIPQMIIDDIDTEARKVDHKRIMLFRTWSEVCGKDATYLRLASVLEELGRRDLIELLIDNFYSDQIRNTIDWAAALNGSFTTIVSTIKGEVIH